MANTVVSLVDLDFNKFKESLKTYAREQSLFKDYDFDGSNFSVLTDILGYNTYHNAFYLNMLFSEMFLDSAQLRNSVASHTKDLNYLPRSFRSAKATVDIEIQTDGTVSSVTIPKNQPFSTRVDSKTYQFVTAETTVVTNNEGGTFTAYGVEIYEGSYILDTFYTNYSIERQRYVLSDPTIDTTSLTVVVSDDDGATTYKYATSLLGVQATDPVFFLQAAESDRYEIVFGNGIIGKKPKNGSTIYAEYRVCSGELPNGAFEFSSDRNIGSWGGVTITTNRDSSGLVIRAAGGAIHESLDDIRFNAPRHYQTQERAVTVNDYIIMLKQKYPEINAITVYGGEVASPPQYGKVFIVVDLFGFDGIPDYKKEEYKLWLHDKIPVTIETVFVDPTFTFARMDVTVRYNQNKTDLTYTDISTRVRNTILNYSATNLNAFSSTLRFSKLLGAIDDSHASILSSYSTFLPYKKIVPTEVAKNYTLEFFMPLKTTLPSLSGVHSAKKEKVISSTAFVYNGKTCTLEDDNSGNIRIVYSTDSDTVSTVTKIGTVDYATGKIILSSFSASSFTGTALKIYVNPESNDVSFGRTDYFEIKDEDISINVIGIRE